jgi:hypothetical protein
MTSGAVPLSEVVPEGTDVECTEQENAVILRSRALQIREHPAIVIT